MLFLTYLKYNIEMLRAKLFLIIGIWVAILPYLGFPSFFKNLLFSITGLILIYISFIFYKEIKTKKIKKFDNFRENVDFEKHNDDIL